MAARIGPAKSVTQAGGGVFVALGIGVRVGVKVEMGVKVGDGMLVRVAVAVGGAGFRIIPRARMP